MAKNEKAYHRHFCKMLFVHEDKSMDEIETMLGVPRSTLYYWHKEDCWEESRKSYRFSAGEIAEQINKSMLAIFKAADERDNKALSGSEADAIAKLNKVRASVLKDSNYMGIAFNVMQRFQSFMRENHPKLATNELPDIVAEFLKKLYEQV